MRKCAYCGKQSEIGSYAAVYTGALNTLVLNLCHDCVSTAQSALVLGQEVTGEWLKENRRMFVLIEERDEKQQLDEPVSLREWTPQGLTEPA